MWKFIGKKNSKNMKNKIVIAHLKLVNKRFIKNIAYFFIHFKINKKL